MSYFSSSSSINIHCIYVHFIFYFVLYLGVGCPMFSLLLEGCRLDFQVEGF
jgi:hypothetical protein